MELATLARPQAGFGARAMRRTMRTCTALHHDGLSHRHAGSVPSRPMFGSMPSHVRHMQSNKQIARFTERHRETQANSDDGPDAHPIVAPFVHAVNSVFGSTVRSNPSLSECGTSIAVREQDWRAVFESLDEDRNGSIDEQELASGLRLVGLPYSDAYVNMLMDQYDSDGDRNITWEEFRSHCERSDQRLYEAWRSFDLDANGRITAEELLTTLQGMGVQATEADAERMVRLLDFNNDGEISFEEFARYTLMLPAAQLRANVAVFDWLDCADWVENPEYQMAHLPPWNNQQMLLAGGIAGVCSRTCIAPLERLKTIMMTSGDGMVASFQTMFANGGFFGMWKGNLTSCIKTFPYTAISYGIYETGTALVKSWKKNGETLTTWERLAVGLVSGCMAASATHPLEVLRTVLMLPACPEGNLLQVAAYLVNDSGWVSLFNGFFINTLRNMTQFGISFCLFDIASDKYAEMTGERPSAGHKAIIGAVIAALVQVLVQPFDLVSRRMLVDGIGGNPLLYGNAWNCWNAIIAERGFAGLYCGLSGNILKIAPNMVATRFFYDAVTKLWALGGIRTYDRSQETKPAAA